MNLDFSEELKNDERFYDEFLGERNEDKDKSEDIGEIIICADVNKVHDSHKSDSGPLAPLSRKPTEDNALHKKPKSRKCKNDDTSSSQYSQKGIVIESYRKDKEVMRQQITIDTSDAVLVKFVSMQTGKTLGEIYSWLVNQHRKELLSLINIK